MSNNGCLKCIVLVLTAMREVNKEHHLLHDRGKTQPFIKAAKHKQRKREDERNNQDVLSEQNHNYTRLQLQPQSICPTCGRPLVTCTPPYNCYTEHEFSKLFYFALTSY